jgi:hypothetical protein
MERNKAQIIKSNWVSIFLLAISASLLALHFMRTISLHIIILVIAIIAGLISLLILVTELRGTNLDEHDFDAERAKVKAEQAQADADYIAKIPDDGTDLFRAFGRFGMGLAKSRRFVRVTKDAEILIYGYMEDEDDSLGWASDNWAVRMPFRANRPGGLIAKSMALQAAASSGSSIEFYPASDLEWKENLRGVGEVGPTIYFDDPNTADELRAVLAPFGYVKEFRPEQPWLIRNPDVSLQV